MKSKYLIIITVVVVAANVLAQVLPWRWDMTQDKRYSLQPATLEVVSQAGDVTITNYLAGDLNSGFRRLKDAVRVMAEDMGVRYREAENPREGMNPIVVHERTRHGKSAQTEIYPYVEVATRDTAVVISLLINQTGLSGEENLNRSVENLEYTMVSAIADLTNPLQDYDIAIITSDTPYDEETRFEMDQFLMEGGRVFWALDGVETQFEMLMKQGYAPVLQSENPWLKQLYRYGLRIEPVWVEDRQCVQYPYFFAPLLLTSEASSITRNLGQVNVSLVSPISVVGGEDGIVKEVLLASSTASRVCATPGEMQIAETPVENFVHEYIPVAYSLEGEFPSAFRHLGTQRESSLRTRQIIVGTSSILKDGMPGMSNEDFLENCFRWLMEPVDDERGISLLDLRKKTVALRLLNDQRAYQYLTTIQVLAVGLPILLLVLLGGICGIWHSKKYQTNKTTTI